MPSIFIWKASTPNTSKKTIRLYSGSNWVLEDNEFSSKSYIYLEQIVISESDNSVITFNSKDMPQDWTGSDLLEVSSVPYSVIKSDIYGTLEHIGEWFRFILKKEIEFNSDSLKNEYNNIVKWMSSKNSTLNSKPYMQKTHNKTHNKNESLNIDKIQLDFQEFLIKYNLPVIQHNSNNKNNNYSFKHNKAPYKNHKAVV